MPPPKPSPPAEAPLSIPDILSDPSDLSPEWLTMALRADGLDFVVRSFKSEPIGTGQMAHNERITLEYEKNATGGDRQPPRTLVGKFPSPSVESRAAGARGGYRSETLFYTEIAEQLPIRTPACYYGAIADDEATFTLLLEDLAPAEQGDQIGGAGPDEIEVAVRNLAGLHAPRWCDPGNHDLDWVTQGMSEEYALYIELGTPAFIERYRERLSAEDVETLQQFARGVRQWIARRPAETTLVHGDYRLDNLMFDRSGGAVSVATVDWQTLSVACGGQDLAYLLGNSSPPEERRKHESRMLEVYRESMAELGVDRTSEEIFSDYRYGCFQGPSITMLGSLSVGQTDRGDDMFMVMAARSAAQIRDLGALDLLA